MQNQLSAKEEAALLKMFRDEATKQAAFVTCINCFQQRIYWHIRRIVIGHEDADDVLQNTFIKVWENIANFRAESKLSTWIFSIATNEALQFLNKQKKNQFVPIEHLQEQLAQSLKTDVYFNGDQLQLALQEAILALPEKQRLVFNMKYFDEMKYEEIAQILGTSVGGLKASYHHAVNKVEQHIKRKLS
jgi:RNA polymerase sigma factor (sigma-70 family)